MKPVQDNVRSPDRSNGKTAIPELLAMLELEGCVVRIGDTTTLDIAFREDECRKRKDNSAENFAVLRRITLNLLKQEKTCKRSIAGKRLLAGWDDSYLEKVLFNF